MNTQAQQAEQVVSSLMDLKIRYLRELTKIWMRKDFFGTSKVVSAHSEMLKAKYCNEQLTDCMAYFVMIGSTPPVECMPLIRDLITKGVLHRQPKPFFDFEGEDSILTFVEARVSKMDPDVFARVHQAYRNRLAEVEPASGTFFINP